MLEVNATVVDSTHLELSEAISREPGEPVKVLIDFGKAFQEVEARSAGGQALGREREQAWCRAHQDILREYAGQWIVLEGEEIVA
ncbi:MAG: hypothetical protein GY842_13800, partial [bacterium]|nr:hypothetical protein [bacterium]